jgi:hypothetical protein
VVVSATGQLSTTLSQGKGNTFSIDGRVMDAATSVPLSEAVVLLVSGDNKTVVANTTSSADGHFTFASISGGSYRIAAALPGYARAEYGASDVGRPGKIIILDKGLVPAEVLIALHRNTSVAGKLIDESGVGIGGVHVTLLTRRRHLGAWRLLSWSEQPTDLAGWYHFDGLDTINFYLFAHDAPEVVPSHGREECKCEEDDTNSRLSSLYYSGSPDAETAQPISAASGTDLVVPSFKLGRGHLGCVRVSRRSDIPAKLVLNVLPVGHITTRPDAIPIELSTAIDSEVDLRLTNGEYIIAARSADGNTVYDAAEVTIGGSSASRLTIEDKRCIVSGRVVADGEEDPSKALVYSALRIRFSPVNIRGSYREVQPDDGGAFRIDQLPPDLYFVQLLGLAADSYVSSLSIVGLGDRTTPLYPAASVGSGNVTIHVGTDAGAIAGTASSPTQGMANPMAVLVPEDPSLAWSYKVTSLTREGWFGFVGVPPGQYRIASVDNLARRSDTDDEAIELARLHGERLSVTPRAQMFVSLKTVWAGADPNK